MWKIIKTVFCGIIICCWLTFAAYGEIPNIINYQAMFSDKTNKPLEGAYAVTFKLYETETAATSLWQETHSGVVIKNGVLSIILGTKTPLNLAFDKQYFLEITFNGEIMGPRQRLTSIGYAIRAKTAERADIAVSAQYAETADVADSLTDPYKLIPKGAIVMCRTSCPVGYKRVGELDGKFLVGGTSYNSSAGGSNQKTLTIQNMPAHNHNISHSHSIKVTRLGPTRGGLSLYDTTSSSETDGLISSSTSWSGSTGNGQSFDVRPGFATIFLCEKE